jgi:CubicO group peptidase (beta-lactamase class C family)
MTSFGHTGFTGTMAWADPETEIVYIFFNRTFQEILQINYQEKIFEKIFRLSFMMQLNTNTLA